MGWIDQGKTKVPAWMRENKYFVGVFLFSLVLIVYFFPVTAQQALWFDEADYMNYARFLAEGSPEWGFNPVRPPLFSLIAAFFFKIGLGEMAVRLLGVAFYLLNVFLVYVLGKSLFGKVPGVIASFLTAVYWSQLFFTFRLLVDVPVLTFWLLSLVFFVKGYILKEKKWMVWALFPAVFIGFLMKYTNALVLLPIVGTMVITRGVRWVKEKDVWISAGIAGIMTIPFFIWQYAAFGHPFAFFIRSILQKGDIRSSGFFDSLIEHVKFLFPLSGWLVLVLFLIGLVFFLDVFLRLDLWLRKKEKLDVLAEKKVLIVLWFVAILLFVGRLGYGAYIEERYYFSLQVAMFLVIGYALVKVYEAMQGEYKKAFVFGMAILLLFAAYENVTHANALIRDKAESFKQVKEAGAWLEEHLAPDEKFWSQTVSAEMQYHANRRNSGPGYNVDDILKDTKLKYLVLTGFNQMVPEFSELPSKHPDIFVPVQGYTIDGQNPIVIIFEIKR